MRLAARRTGRRAAAEALRFMPDATSDWLPARPHDVLAGLPSGPLRESVEGGRSHIYPRALSVSVSDENDWANRSFGVTIGELSAVSLDVGRYFLPRGWADGMSL